MLGIQISSTLIVIQLISCKEQHILVDVKLFFSFWRGYNPTIIYFKHLIFFSIFRESADTLG